MKQTKGFTLIELLVAISLFAFFMLCAVNIFSFISKTQRTNLESQKFYTSLYQIIDSIKLSLKSGYINYEYYKDFDYNINWPENTLALKDDLGFSAIYKLGNKACNNGIDFCIEKSLDGGSTWINLTPENILIDKMDFYISPRSDTFKVEPTEWDDCKYFYLLGECICITSAGCFNDQICELLTCRNPKKMGLVTILLSGRYKRFNNTFEEFNYQTTIEVKKYLKWF